MTLALVPLFFLVAVAYAMAGFGGGSSYIALLSLFEAPYEAIPPVALLCNIIVVAGGAYHFTRAGHLYWRLFLPFAAASTPAAFLTGRIVLDKTQFMWLLAVSLTLAGIHMLITPKALGISANQLKSSRMWGLGLPLGALLGALSGLVGIGGGIFLSPLLAELRWGTSKQIAATASWFILVNSLSGLAGQLTKGYDAGLLSSYIWLLPAVLVGGQVGSILGARKLSYAGVRVATALLVMVAAGNLFRKLLF
ncbi:MAG: sulfite exporter TauE/SafE family protein [Candidatus Hydrogenedentes bacterium]|nr:sulfite exporter TauE/SafE family protein [Candidatus Hydrogenedentota bacterium]